MANCTLGGLVRKNNTGRFQTNSFCHERLSKTVVKKIQKILGNGELNPGPPRAVLSRT